MYTFHSIKELLNALTMGKDLLGELFGKRKSFDYRYEQAIELLDEGKVQSLIEKGLLVRNGRYLEIDDQLLTFFEQILDVNEEINTSLINEHLTQLKQNIDYYLAEDNEYRRHKYLKLVKGALRKVGIICIRNIVDLNRNIDNAFKTEPNYRIKIKKLENYDQRRLDIKQLISRTDKLLSGDELTFFATARDEELQNITTGLRLLLQEARHNLIETEKQIIDFLNQVKHQSKVMEKIRQVKYLKDQFELETKSDIVEQLRNSNALAFETRPVFPLKLGLDILQEDDTYALIQALNQKIKSKVTLKVPLAGAIGASFFSDTQETGVFIDMEVMKQHFAASGYHLLHFVLRYDYPKPVSFEEMVTCYCQLISLYEAEFRFTDEYITHKNTEFSVVYPK
ncbi:hypothetical protein SAMN06265379_101520 [Saccharicrinis carchari]|uniref:Uncharacterized protein n=1 Tax=Saccharicrinis carchari TaxID=1168039 RepID=A0A521AY49_SACCC|nr:hypothetical protein [Saccharicrinis carchari]SMO39767.1 hypothetical protein SAMN06265379_101520 [Saccharicrinis carchari]